MTKPKGFKENLHCWLMTVGPAILILTILIIYRKYF